MQEPPGKHPLKLSADSRLPWWTARASPLGQGRTQESRVRAMLRPSPGTQRGNRAHFNVQPWASDPITSWHKDGETVTDCIFEGFKITADGDCSHEIKTLASWKESYDQPRQLIKKLTHYFANKGLSSQRCGFSSSHVWT